MASWAQVVAFSQPLTGDGKRANDEPVSGFHHEQCACGIGRTYPINAILAICWKSPG